MRSSPRREQERTIELMRGKTPEQIPRQREALAIQQRVSD
jgi:hypothetical protein